MAVSVRCIGTDEYNLAVECLNRNWSAGHILARDKKLFDWTFLRSDLWDRDGYSFAVAEDNGRPIGQLGGVPFEFNRFGKTGMGVSTANWSIEPKARTGSTGLQLLFEFQRPPFDLVMLFGMGAKIRPLMEALKYQSISQIPRFLMILSDGERKFRRLIETTYPEWSKIRIDDLISTFQPPNQTEFPVKFDAKIPDNWDGSTWRRLAEQTVGAARNFRYLKWRYLDHPSYDYQFVHVEEKSGHGLAIWRSEDIRLEDGEEDSTFLGNFGRIVEFLAPSSECAASLAMALKIDLETQGAFAADFWGYNGPSGSALRNAGFRLTQSHADGRRIPTRFQPIDIEMIDIYSAVLGQNKAPTPEFSASCPWLWTKGDADMDRPKQ